jgi:predicted Zn-dependent protease
MSRSRPTSLIAGLLASALLTGCVTQPLQKAMGSEATASTVLAPDAPLPPPPARTWSDPAQDVDVYRVQGWGLVSMPALQRYLNRLYASVKATAGQPDWPGSVYILSAPEMRATATQAGNVFISLGWLRTIETEDELVALLSHEFGHVYLNHHAGQDVRNAVDLASRVASVAWALANRNLPGSGSNGVMAIMTTHEVGMGIAMPAWQRSQEDAADRLGAALSLRMGYSYTQGFKLFLEHIDSYDATQLKAAEASSLRTAETERAAAVRSAAEQARRQLGTPSNQLTQTATDLQVGLAGHVADAESSLKRTLAEIKGRITDNHDSAAGREETLTRAMMPLLAGKPRPPARAAPWKAALAERDTAVILQQYALIPSIESAIVARNLPEARRLAQQAASGVTANDAAPLVYLQMVTELVQPGAAAPDFQARNLRAAERSWQFQLRQAQTLARRDRARGRALAEQQFEYFRKAPPAWPDLIAFYRDNGFVDQAKAMAQDCVWAQPSYRVACLESAKTESDRAVEKAASEREAKRLVDKWIKPR